MTCGLAISLSQKNLTVDNVKKKKKKIDYCELLLYM